MSTRRGPWPGAASRPSGAWPGARERVDRGPTVGAGLRREPMVKADLVGAERIERPVLEEDVDRLAERGGTGGQHRGGLELVVGPGEEDQVQGFIHRGHLEAERAGTGASGVAGGVAADGAGPDTAEGSTALAAIAPSRVRRRSSTARMRPQATITSGSASR